MKEERRILLVDDEPMVLKSVSRYLQTMGCAVTACADSHDALREASGGFDMAVVDFDLPGLSGSAYRATCLRGIHIAYRGCFRRYRSDCWPLYGKRQTYPFSRKAV